MGGEFCHAYSIDTYVYYVEINEENRHDQSITLTQSTL